MQQLRLNILLLLLTFIISALHAQIRLNNSSALLSKAWQKDNKEQHCDIHAALLAQHLRTGKPLSKLKKQHPFNELGQTSYVPALLSVSEDFKKESFAAFDIQVNTALTNLYSIQIPIEHFQAFLNIPGIEYIELAKQVSQKLDKALLASNVNPVHEGQNLSQSYKGKDVVVGIIDVGFDYTHPTFKDNETGLLRIKKVWEQSTLNGNPPSGFTYGQELSEEQTILNARADLTISGHGTHVASIAAGNGGSLKERYRGVAYESDIVLVQLNVREGATGNSSGVIDGINYIFRYAELVGKPAVINISQGHHFGPHDGTSLTDQAIDEMSGPGKIIVGAVGNEGNPDGFYLHFDHTFDNENAILSYLVWPDEISAGVTLVDIWGEAGDDFRVNLELFNPGTNTKEGSSEILDSDQPVSFVNGTIIDQEGDTLYYEGGVEINAINNRPHALLYIDNTGQSKGNDVNLTNLLDNDFVQLRFQSNSGTVHAYAANNSGEAFLTDLSGIGANEFINGVRVLGGNPNSTMGELGGTARSIISVGGYNTTNSFINASGQGYSVEDRIDEAYINSSRGPTLDGRIKPDICAPASLIAAAENSFNVDFDTSIATDRISNANGNHWYFGIRRGTSAAAPMVTGIIALMLELDPEMTPSQAKELLTDQANQDNFTGQVPNQKWGYGKVDAHNVMTKIDQVTSTDSDIIINAMNIFPNPNNGSFTIKSQNIGPVDIRILNAAGQEVLKESYHSLSGQVKIKVPEPINGIYFLQIKQEDQIIQKKFVVLR